MARKHYEEDDATFSADAYEEEESEADFDPYATDDEPPFAHGRP